ncbi:MAG: GntR family transcriptional regulator, partial [Hafnia sp.]
MNISEKTYHQLKTKIIANELVGAVSENELCQELNVSRTPLREAIFRLMTEGWIEPSKNKTKTIKPITFSEIKDIFQIRKDIEIMVLNLSWDNQNVALYTAIRDKIQLGFKTENQDLLLEADNELHEQMLTD